MIYLNYIHHFFFSINKHNSLEKLINPQILSFELHKKNYIISSYLLTLIINIFSLLGEEFNIYSQLDKYEDNIKENYIQNEEINDLNKYFNKYQNLLLLLNKDHYKIIYNTINILVPYINESLNNNFFLFLPFSIINGILFFVKFFFQYIFVYKKYEILVENNIKELMNIFININVKISESENINKKFIIEAIKNIELFLNLLDYLNQIKDMDKKKDDKLGKDELINNFFNEKHFNIIFNSIKNNYFKSDNDIMKEYEYFILYFSCENCTEYSEYFSQKLLKHIEKDEDDFWLNTFIINVCIKRKIINKIVKISKISKCNNNNNDEISKSIYDKLYKYFNYIFIGLSFILNYLNENSIIIKYFNKFIDKQDINSQEEDFKIDIESNEKDIYPIYYYFIQIASLIINNLLNNDFFMLFKKKNFSKITSFLFNIIDKSIIYFQTLIISIPNNYQDILDKSKKNNKKSKKMKNNELKENNNIEQYYKNIIINIKKNNFANLICLLEKYDQDIPIFINSYLTILKSLISFINDNENKYNKVKINSQEQKEIAITCPICLDHHSDCHVSPCGHMFCFSCIQKFTDYRCPICRNNMNGVLEYPNFQFPHNTQINNHHIINPFNLFNDNESINRRNNFIIYNDDNLNRQIENIHLQQLVELFRIRRNSDN